MSLETNLMPVIDGTRRDLSARAMRVSLAGLAYMYTAGLEAFLLPYRIGIRRQAQLACPVISVGNITSGGTGKTPMTLRLCEHLREQGLRVCVLSRGYHGAKERSAGIVSTETSVELSAAQAGDEAHMLAQLLPGVPVLVGKDRRVTGAIAIEQFRPDVIVLDDGMQFYQLCRDVEIVLVDAHRPFDNGWTFPRGLLREPPSHLGRADVVVITNSDRVSTSALDALHDVIDSFAPGVPIYEACTRGTWVRALDRQEHEPAESIRDLRVGTTCGLGNPDAFEDQVRQTGARIVYTKRFPDHYAPTMAEITKVISEARSAGARAIVVSDKDAVKLPPIMRPLPFVALAARITLDNEDEFFGHILEAVR